MLPPSGTQFEITFADYRAVVTESGAALRHLSSAGRDLVDGFEENELSSGGRGQILMPWPNRIRDGRYAAHGTSHQLALTEPGRANASHGLARWAGWTPVEYAPTSVTLGYRLMAQSGYPWLLDLTVTYGLDESGLTVTQSATNQSASAAPYASGAHPYLRAGDGPVDSWLLTLPADTRALSDERLLPVDTEPVAGTPYDFGDARAMGDVQINHGFTDLHRVEDGTSTTTLVDPADGEGVALWVDDQHKWLLLYTADDVPATARRSLAVEPMTANADAFNSGDDLIMLEAGATFSATWGIRALSGSAPT